MNYNRFLFLKLFCFLQIGLRSQDHSFPPPDQTSFEPSLQIFINDLKEAIEMKNENWIYSVLDREVTSSFGDDPGKDAFVRYWDPANDSSAFWQSLDRAVRLGGAFTDRSERNYQVVFPYVFTDPEVDKCGDEIAVITGSKVNLRAKPSANAQVVMQLNYDVVCSISPYSHGKTVTGEAEWYFVRTVDEQFQGWVFWKYIYNPVFGPRLFILKDSDEHWRISAFIEGD